ncbi:glycosyltransferase family 2 protein [Pseudomonadota bacterium]
MNADTNTPVSVLILTLNEADNIERCIESLSWCDDIVILDSFSADDTLERAMACGARVFQRKFDNFAAQRNHALDQFEFKHDWILHLDADEVVTPELAREIAEKMQDRRFAAYRIASKMMFMGKWLRHSGMYPCYQVRLGRKDQLRFEQVGHGQREVTDAGAVGTLEEPYVHYGFSKGMADWLERHNRYSSDEALTGIELLRGGSGGIAALFSTDPSSRRRALKRLSVRLPFRPALRFIYMYCLRLGFLDGRAGFVYCRLLAMYEYWIVLKMREMKKA